MGMDVYGKKPADKAGEYFRASIWSWRPIHQLCEVVTGRLLESWGFNDGAGFDTQEECNDLAERLERYLTAFPKEKIEIESDIRVGPADPVHGGRRLMQGTGGDSAYSADREHVKKFIMFLRSCGGFEIC